MLLAGCGGSTEKSQYVECDDKARKQMGGALLVADGGVNRNRCKNLGTGNKISEEDMAELNEKVDAHEDNGLCQISNHKNTNWLCVYTAY